MLFDEPTAALDPELVGEVLEVMLNIVRPAPPCSSLLMKWNSPEECPTELCLWMKEQSWNKERLRKSFTRRKRKNEEVPPPRAA